MVVLSARATHHITHIDPHNDWSVDVYLMLTTQENLVSDNPITRSNARATVVIRFNEACVVKYGDTWRDAHVVVDYRRLTITEL